MILSLTMSFADFLTALLQVNTVGAPEEWFPLGGPVPQPSCRALLTLVVSSSLTFTMEDKCVAFFLDFRV